MVVLLDCSSDFIRPIAEVPVPVVVDADGLFFDVPQQFDSADGGDGVVGDVDVVADDGSVDAFGDSVGGGVS